MLESAKESVDFPLQQTESRKKPENDYKEKKFIFFFFLPQRRRGRATALTGISGGSRVRTLGDGGRRKRPDSHAPTVIPLHPHLPSFFSIDFGARRTEAERSEWIKWRERSQRSRREREREREAIKRRERGAAKAACVGVSETGFVVLFAVFPNDDKNRQYKKAQEINLIWGNGGRLIPDLADGSRISRIEPAMYWPSDFINARQRVCRPTSAWPDLEDKEERDREKSDSVHAALVR